MVHNINEIRERFSNLIYKLDTDYRFSDYLDADSPEDFEWSWNEYDDAADHLGIWTGSGATKIVIGDEYRDSVIKFQLPYHCREFNYCAREVEVYNEAVKHGFGDQFAWSAHLFDYTFEVGGDVVTVPFYVMEYCQCGYDSIDDEMYEWHYTKYRTELGLEDCDATRSKYNTVKYNKDLGERMMEWACSVWNLPYANGGIAKFMRDMYINDIHCGNWGWIGDRLVLVDYSGYGEYYSGRDIDY